MATRRIIIDPSHPATMTPEQRRAELATILAAGLVRLIRAGHPPGEKLPDCGEKLSESAETAPGRRTRP